MPTEDQRQQARGGSGPVPPPGSISALLREIARTPEADSAAASAWDHVLVPGMRIDRFELVREIGRGGFGVVWEARDGELGRSVAFKAVRPGRAPDVQERLLREAELAARLSHPNIVTLHDVGRSEHGPYLILELLHGRTLEDRLDQGSLPLREALHVAIEVAKGIGHAHGQGVFHRDLKPANVFLCDDGRVKILDFGLAHAFGHRRPDGGTLPYMAPEQLRGAPEDERTDVFALGAILYRILTGELPFPGGRGAGEDVREPRLEVAGLPVLGELVTRMLAQDPVQRPRDGSEVLASLSALPGEAQAAGHGVPPVRARPGRSRPHRETVRSGAARRLGLLGGAGLVVLLAAVLPWRDRVAGWLAPPTAETLVVLPFHDVGGDQARAAISAGLCEIVTNGLRQLEQLRGSLLVVASSDVLRERVSSAREARAAFGATRVLEGSVHWGLEVVTVAVNLVDARTLNVLDARTVDVPLAEAASLRRLLVERVAGMLRLDPESGLSADPAPAPGAYEFYLQGRGYLQRYDRIENLDSAVAVLDLALARDPDYALAHAGKAEAHLRRFQLTKDPRFLDDARASAARASALAPRLAAVQLTAGTVHAAAGELSDAIRSYERALEIEPASAEAHRELARAYDAAGRTEQAEATYLRAIELRPGSWASYKDLGVFYNRHGRLAEALPMFQRVVELTPDNYAGYANLGGLHLRLGQHDEAAAMLERSLALRPTAQGHANLGTVHFYQGRYAQAARAYRSATELNPTDPRLWGNLGDAERWAGRGEEAAQAYRKAVELLGRELAVNPRNAEPWSRLAIHQAALGLPGGALASIEKALRLEPRDGQVLFRSALVHEEAGRRDRALEALRAALQAGYSAEEIEKAPPLEALREDPRYGALARRPPVPGEGPR